jgi:uncharacterized protein (TIGR00661 family)
MQNIDKISVLIVPLDWGLGHATRCVPIIRELLKQDCTVLIAGEGKTKTLLQQEFPQLQFLPVEGYRIKYAKTKSGLIAKLFFQIPKILSAIRRENNWLRKTVAQYNIDAVISDNRYGLHHPEIYSVFITHQLYIKTPFSITGYLLQQINYWFINRFNECWAPDFCGEPNLSGKLSHPKRKPSTPVIYLGPLSRFHLPSVTFPPKHLLILLSGPEPQRSLLEKKLLEQLVYYKDPVLLVRGLPGVSPAPQFQAPDNVSVIHHLPSELLQQAIAEAWMVIGRCGYSTVMDLITLQKKSILIPTPGQTEQEYLAHHLMNNCLALCIEQDKFKLTAALSLSSSFPYQLYFKDSSDRLKEVLHAFVQQRLNR